MKTKTLATVAILICSLVLAPSLLRAEENEWYQGQQGQWQRHGNGWQWKSTHGDQYRQSRNGWQWYGNGACENAQRLENQARVDRRTGHPAAADDVDRQAAAARANCYRR
jgi:hypothetical protein